MELIGLYLGLVVILPILILFFIPFAVLLYLYSQALFVQVYKKFYKLADDYSQPAWDCVRKLVAKAWLLHASLWHDFIPFVWLLGYEIVGLENVPQGKPAIIIFYHGVVPVDLYYIVTLLANDPTRDFSTIGDKFMFKIWGFPLYLHMLNVHTGTFESCCAQLRRNQVLIISPGGAREAVFSDSNYGLLWNKRSGFARIAMAENVAVIPAFTQNIKEGYLCATFGLSIFRKFYEKYRWPLIPIYGGFPVKLKTYFGKPIYPYRTTPFMNAGDYSINAQSNDSSDQGEDSKMLHDFIQRCHEGLEGLIKEHQKIPGSITRAIWERIWDKPFHYISVDKFFAEKKKDS